MKIKHQWLNSQLNDQTVQFLTIKFSMTMKLNSSLYYYVSLTIHKPFVYTKVNDQTVLF